MSMKKFLKKFLESHGGYLVVDLAQCERQETFTTKHARREKTLAYIFEAVSGMRADNCTLPNEADTLEWTKATDALRVMAQSPEAQTAYDRVTKRLSFHLTELDKRANGKDNRCEGCGLPIKPGESCDCNNASGRAKDAAMARDV